MKQYEYSARNVQEAIIKGLKELDIKQEDVDIKILAEGGIFSKAKILIITEEEEIVPEVKKAEQKVKKAKKETKTEEKPAKKTVKKKSKKQITERRESVEFVKELAKKLGLDLDVSVTKQEENTLIEMSGENAGMLIGYRGEGLSSIQYLANVVELRTVEKPDRTRIIVDVENYKEKRKQALISLAGRIAKKVIRTGRYQRLEPMNAYERLIIHTALQDEDVTTFSKGEEPRRYLVIEPKVKKQEIAE
jgi:spoIIIJ-associated protein